jgi:Xaa-Pro aminopeptidase
VSEQRKPDKPVKGRKNGLYPGISEQLEDAMRSGWSDTERRDVEPSEQSGYAAKRRKAVSGAFAGERIVIPAGRLKTRSNDLDYGFRAASDYAYLTADQTENSVLVLEPLPDGGHEAILYLLPRSDRENGEFWLDGQGELWVGRRRSLAEARAELGLETRDSREAAERITRSVADAPHVVNRILRGHDAVLESALDQAGAAGRRGAEEAAGLDEELKVFMHGLRLVKDDWEIEQLRRACEVTVQGFRDVVRELAQAVATSERWIEGTFYRRARVEGNDVGYSPICAAGPNATVLHWARNNGAVRPGELLLLDAGAETESLYSADVTRTLPISGSFTEIQRRIYDAVYDAQEAGIAAVRPGARFRDFHEAAQRVLAERLIAWGLLDGPLERVLDLGLQRRYTLHGTGHMLGLDVHDCADARCEEYVDGTLRPGMVLTVEPGLYFQLDDQTAPPEYRGIGVRIEDDILVTADGNENLSAALPRRSDQIEGWMRSLTA